MILDFYLKILDTTMYICLFMTTQVQKYDSTLPVMV